MYSTRTCTRTYTYEQYLLVYTPNWNIIIPDKPGGSESTRQRERLSGWSRSRRLWHQTRRRRCT